MITWAKRYVKLLVSYIQNGELNESSAHHRVKNKGILPTGTFRFWPFRKRTTVKKEIKHRRVLIDYDVCDQIVKTAGGLKSKDIGLLGSSKQRVAIDKIIFNNELNIGKEEFLTNTTILNKTLEGWEKTDFRGFVQNIPIDGYALSSAEIEYAIRIMKSTSQVELFWLFVDRSKPIFSIFRQGYVIKSNGEVIPCSACMKLPDGTFRAGSSRKHTPAKKSPVKPTITITEDVYQQIVKTIGSLKPEKGGMLGSRDGIVIDRFVFDKNAKTGTSEYSPNTIFLNRVLEGEWSKVNLRGFVHSHPFNGSVLSDADIEYAIRIMKAASLPELFMPLVNSSACGKFRIFGYIVKSNGKAIPCNIKRIENEIIDVDEPEMSSSLTEEEIMKRFESDFSPVFDEPEVTPFSRVESTLNIGFLKTCTVIGVGCGGAREFYLDMARVGVENFYLMDGDTVTVQNIASQNVYSDEIGLSKTDVTKKNILRINPSANVVSIPEMLNDEKTDEWFESTILANINKQGNVVLCAFTDSFNAQARLSRLALKYDLPFLSAQHHAKGETSEIVFWYPGVTQYCQREILRDRYESYQNGYKNSVTSDGSPIFNTSRLNSICTKLATGMLLYKDSEFNLYSMFLTMKPNSNLLVIRQNSLLNSDSNLAQLFTADEAGYFFDDIVWIDVDTIIEYDEVCECRKEIIDTRRLFE
jgi:hypothetical protein